MTNAPIVAPLEETWRDVLDGIARARRWPTTHDVARLVPKLVRLSAAYNDPDVRGLASLGEDTMVARLLFSFVRDVPKVAGAVRELVASGMLGFAKGRPLRVLDLGAGLGASTWGLVRALAATGAHGIVEATWVDPDRLALDVARNIVGKGGTVDGITLTPKSSAVSLEEGLTRAPGPYDLVLMGQVLSELDRAATEDERVAKHVALIERILARSVEPDGTLVIVEPALRDRTRHLHRVRDALCAAKSATVFAPCLHQSGCPALRLDTDWCHEDLAIDLPAWLVPIARGAGLRFEGLTFSYLVLRRDGKTLANALEGPPGGRVRVVSNRLATKGKSELFLCGELEGTSAGSGTSANPDGDGARFTRLDRDARPHNEAWDTCVRGDLLRITPPPGPKPRLSPDTAVRLLPVISHASAARPARRD